MKDDRVFLAHVRDAIGKIESYKQGERQAFLADPKTHNDLDSFEIMVKVAPNIRPGQFIVSHAWENYQFRNQKGFQNLIPSPLNPVELAGGQYHLRLCLQPSHTDRDARVEVTKL